MKIPVLEKNDTWFKIIKKLAEEIIELVIAIIKRDKKNIAEEALDVIQVAIGVLDKLEEEGMNIESVTFRHLGKLINRGWKFKKVLEVKRL